MVTDHFNEPCAPMTKFWLRGQSVSLLALCYLLTQEVKTDVGVKVAALSSVAVGILYPWNAKFGYLNPEQPAKVKYPLHYFPEGLMLVLSVVGGLIVAANA